MNLDFAFSARPAELERARAIVGKFDEARADAAVDWSPANVAALHEAERSIIRACEHFTGRSVSERKPLAIALKHKGNRHFQVLPAKGTVDGSVLIERTENGDQVHFGPGVDSGIPRVRPR